MHIKKLIAAGAVGAALLGTTVALEAPAQAATGCATRTMYRHVTKGMLLWRANEILHQPGHIVTTARAGGFVTQLRNYRACSQFSAISIAYGNSYPGGPLRVESKAAVWVS